MKASMKRLIAMAGLLACCSLVNARPRVIQETQWLPAPNPAYTHFAGSVAIDGDWALATALLSTDGTYEYPYQQLALLYRRVGNTWAFERTLVDDETDEASWNYPTVAMKNGLASVSTSPLRAFRRVGEEWVALPAPFPAAVGSPEFANGQTRIDGSSIASITNRCFYGAGTADFANGSWTAPQFVTGNARLCSVANYGGALDLAGNTLAVSNPQDDSIYPATSLKIYDRAAAGMPWQLTSSLPTGEWGFGLALLGDDLLVGDWNPRGNLVYRRGAGGWQPAGHLPTLKGFSRVYEGAYHIARSGDLALFNAPLFDDLPGAIAVYRRNASGAYQHVALLIARNGDRLGGVVDISGRTVVVSGHSPDSVEDGRLYFFELPADFTVPAIQQDNFEDGEASGWRQDAGEFSVTRRGGTQVFRQSALAGAGTAILVDSDTTTQAITVDIRPLAFDGEDRWAGVATRYRDADNHYYVTLRNSGSIELRRIRGGEITTLDSRPLTVGVNGNFRVRLESVGTRHRVFVNGVQQLSAIDGAFSSGRVGLLTYRTSADFDNVLLTPALRQSIYATDIVNGGECEQFIVEPELRVTGTPEWDCSVYERSYLRQASVEGIARAAIGPVTGDQAVEARLRVETFAENGTQDKWLGVMTRYSDENNYYYLVARSSNVVSLRKLVNGEIVELDRADFTVTPGAWYRMRLEAVGDQLRGYVNDVLRVEATDSSLATGISGIATYRTAARIDFFRVFQP
jgi:hypothetical protein